MVQTRSAAKRQQQAKEVQRLSAVPKPLVREPTIIEITPSATGLGTHIRWLRPPQGPNETSEILSSDMTLDPRFVTPAPETQALLRTPPKLGRHCRIGNAAVFNTGTTVRFNLFRHEVEHMVESARVHGRNILTEFELYSFREGTSSDLQHDALTTDTFGNILQYQTLGLISPLTGTDEQSMPVRLGPHGTHPDISPNDLGPTYTQDNNPLRLGPHGTHLDISQGDSAPNSTQAALLTGRERGLGTTDTVLVGLDGQAIVPGIRPRY